MKKRNINKIIAFTLCLTIFSVTLVSAKTTSKLRDSYNVQYKYLPSDPDRPDFQK